jgi:predicted nucleic acid-binding protein
MSEAVLDASVVLKWFHSEGEDRVKESRELRTRFEAGELRVLAPPLLWLELLNVAARRWGWAPTRLEQLAATLPNLGFELPEPELSSVARWAASGLTAYDAAYVAVAEQAGVALITDDEQIVRGAPEVAVALGEGPAAPERGESP